MSSKVGQNQAQGRRRTLSLTGGGQHAHQQQQQHKRANSALATTQEQKSAATVVTRSGNNNGAKNQESNNLNQKESKKAAQQNLNGNGNGDGTASGSDVVIDRKMDGNANNGTANAKIIKEEDNKETENNKDEPKKSATAKQQTEEIKQNKAAEQPSEQVPLTTNAAKSNDNITSANEKKQTAATSKANANGQKPATPADAIEEGTATPPAESPSASKSGTPSKSKSPRGGAVNCSNGAAADVELLPILDDPSPQEKAALIMPAATSTPAKLSAEKRSGVSAKDEAAVINKDSNSGSPVDGIDIPRVFSQISGRRSIRSSLESFTPNVNTELDVTGTTNTTMNDVTVGSEIPNNSSFLSFSLFGRGRKRERTPPTAVELTTEPTTPPKRARLDVNGIFTAMSSPLTLLRSRFSKTTLESSSTPAKLNEPNVATAVDDVQNISGVSIEEVACSSKNLAEVAKAQQDITVEKEVAIPSTSPNKKTSPKKKKTTGKDIDEPATNVETNESKEAPAKDVDNGIQMKETPIIAANGDLKAKQRGCTIM